MLPRIGSVGADDLRARHTASDSLQQRLRYKTPEEFAQQCRSASPTCSSDTAEGQPPQDNPAGSLRSAECWVGDRIALWKRVGCPVRSAIVIP